jgi:DNA-binding transcriptional LysR family regulator
MSVPTDKAAFLNLRHLAAWLAVVEEGSVTAGARRLSISQPALSQQLRTLERHIGGALLERLPHGVQPTPLGRALLHDARATLAAAGRLHRQAQRVAGHAAGVLEIATLASLADATLLEPMREWHRLHPDVALRLSEFPRQEQMEESASTGAGDVAIGVRPHAWSGPVVSLGYEQFVVVLPPQDPLHGDDSPIALEELSDREWVLCESANGLSEYVMTACAHAGFRPREAVSTSQVQAMTNLAMAGLGATLVPSHTVPEKYRSVARPLDPPIVWELAAFVRTILSPLAAAFVELVKQREWLALPPGAMQLPRALG